MSSIISLSLISLNCSQNVEIFTFLPLICQVEVRLEQEQVRSHG